jgi:hypothetical protein
MVGIVLPLCEYVGEKCNQGDSGSKIKNRGNMRIFE